MPEKGTYAPSRARRTKKTDLPAGEIPGQLSIDDVLAEIAAEQAAAQAAEGLAADLPEVEPAAAELEAIEAGLDELIEQRISELTVQVARYGHHDELDAQRFRHIVRAELRRAENLEVAA